MSWDRPSAHSSYPTRSDYGHPASDPDFEAAVAAEMARQREFLEDGLRKLQQLSPGRGDFGSDFRSAPAALPRAAPAFEPEPLHRDYRERQHAAPAAGHAHKGASYLDDLNMQMEAKRAREKLDRERENAAERARLELDAAPARGGAHRDAAAPRRVSALPEPHDDTNKLSKQQAYAAELKRQMDEAQRRKADKKMQDRLDDAIGSPSVAPLHAGRKMYKDISSAMDHFPSSSMSPDAAPSVYHERVDELHPHRAVSVEDEPPRPGAREATRRASGSAPHANMSAVEIQKVIADGGRFTRFRVQDDDPVAAAEAARRQQSKLQQAADLRRQMEEKQRAKDAEKKRMKELEEREEQQIKMAADAPTSARSGRRAAPSPVDGGMPYVEASRLPHVRQAHAAEVESRRPMEQHHSQHASALPTFPDRMHSDASEAHAALQKLRDRLFDDAPAAPPMDDFVKYSARKEARDAPMHAREPVSSLISPQSYAPSYDSAASRVGPHGGDAVSYAELERLRREQELLRQQVREQMAVVSKLQHVVESVSRERDQVLSLFQAPVAVAPAAYHRDISMHSQPSEYDQYNDDVTAYMLRGGSRATSHDGRHSREQEHASAPHGYAAKASPRRAPPTPPRSHHVQRHVDYDVFQVESEWVRPGAPSDLDDTLRMVGSERPYTAMHAFPGSRPPLVPPSLPPAPLQLSPTQQDAGGMIRRSVSPLLSAASPHKKSPKDPFSVVEQSLASTKQFLFELQDSKDDYERAAAAADANTATQHVQASVSPRQPALSPVAERSSSAAAGAEHASEADDYDSDTFIAVDTLRSPPRSARSTKSNHDVMHADVLQAQSVASITQPPSHAAASLSTSAPLASPASAVDDYEDDAWIPCEDAAADVGLVVTIRK